ncbi:MAG: OpgC domain-containing protein [Rhizobiales bacterium]|nr:OpgC domain-containing protein [Hyphomicrobiales bacterium]
MTATPAHSLGRDARIDVFRGLALVMIFINHMPATPWSVLTLRSWGFSDSAEVFVLLAGVAASLAYGRFFLRGDIWLGITAVASRIWTLYRAHLLLFLIVGTLCVIGAERFNEPSHLEALGFDTFLQNPGAFLGHVVTLGFLPGYLDILPLYIVLLAMLPLLFMLDRLHWAAPLGAALVLWGAVQIWGFNLPNSRTAREWTFNPFAWQLIFVIGFTLGRRMQMGASMGVLARPMVARAMTIAAAVFTLAAFVITAPWREIPGYENVMLVNPAWVGTISKTDLSIIRLLDNLAKLWLVLVLVRPDALWLTRGPFRFAGLMGRHSLEVFALSTALGVAGGIMITVNGFHPGVIALAVLGGVALMISIAAVREWRDAAYARNRKAKGTQATSEAAQVARPSGPETRPAATQPSSRSTLLALDPQA